jgi:hypothetical protein
LACCEGGPPEQGTYGHTPSDEENDGDEREAMPGLGVHLEGVDHALSALCVRVRDLTYDEAQGLPFRTGCLDERQHEVAWRGRIDRRSSAQGHSLRRV